MGESKPGVWAAVTAGFCAVGFWWVGPRELAGWAAGVGVVALAAEGAAWWVRRRRQLAERPAGPRRPRRWLVPTLLLLLAGYPASAGPVAYAIGREWWIGRRLAVLYLPLVTPDLMTGPLGEPFGRYLIRCQRRGMEDRMAEMPWRRRGLPPGW